MNSTFAPPAPASPDVFFDATNVPVAAPRTPIPAGKYAAHITESELKNTQDGAGRYLKLTFEIIEGEHAGRKVFTNLNLWNQNAEAVRIAAASLSAICHAVGRLRISAPQELHHLRMTISVKVKPARGEYEASNDINGFEAYAMPGGAPVPAAAPAAAWNTPPQPQQQAPAPAGWGQQPAAASPAPAPAPQQPAAQQAPPAFVPPPAAGTPAAPWARQ